MVKLRFITDDQGYHILWKWIQDFYSYTYATKTAKSSSHCEKHQLLYDVEISVWNLTVQKKFAMISYHRHWIGIENRMNMFRLFKEKNLDHDSWRPCMKRQKAWPTRKIICIIFISSKPYWDWWQRTLKGNWK